ncbi:MAG: alpha-galactosidase [Planctomycetales bacterium]|nr:alpha-galactosidase [Planctomycetales bacterium]
MSPQIIDGNGCDLKNAVSVKIRRQGDFFNFSLRNNTAKPVRIKEIVLFDGEHGWPGDSAFYGEGFTMLSQTAGTLANMIDIDGLTDRGHYKLPEPDGFRTVYGMMYVTPPNAEPILLGFTSCRRFVGKFDVNAARLRVVLNTEGLTLHPNEHWQLEEFAVLTGADTNTLLKRLAGRISEHHPKLPWPHLPTGWCSWYCFGPEVTAQNIIDNLEQFKQNLPEVRYIQIDDGYQPWMGDWLDLNQNFGGSIKDVIAQIRRSGFEPAIWVAPFSASPESRLFKEHPDWFIKDEQGQPLRSDKVTFGGWRLGPWYMLDGTHPQAQQYLEKIFTVMRQEWGCTYFKLDAIAWGAMPFGRHFDPKASSVQAFRLGMEAIRRGAGDAFLLGCNHPMWPSIGQVHGSRSSMDVSHNWSMFTRTGRENLLRSWQNQQLWWNDPDCLLLSGNLPGNEKMFHASVIYATGGMLLGGDDATGYDPQQWGILKKAAENPGIAAVFEDTAFEVGTIHQPDRILAVFLNWSDQPSRRQIKLERPCRVIDFWTDQDLGLFTETFFIDDFPARSGGIYLLKPAPK